MPRAKKSDVGCNQVVLPQQHFLDHEKISYTKHLLISPKTLVVIIHWTHFRVNGICAESFCPQKMNSRMLLLTGCFYQQDCYI